MTDEGRALSVWRLTIDEIARRAPLFDRAAVAVGNFDGVHLGHAHILRLAVQKAASADETPVALTFDPHPRAVVGRGAPPALATPSDRARLMLRLGVAAVVTLHFDRHVAGLAPEAFVRDVLLDGLGARRVVVGENFRFGRGAAGTTEFLTKVARERGAAVHAAATVRGEDGTVVSSSHIRRLLDGGDVERAAKLLNRAYDVVGRITGVGSTGPEGRGDVVVEPVDGLIVPGEGTYRARLLPAADDAEGAPVTVVVRALSDDGAELRTMHINGLLPAGHGLKGLVRVRFLARDV